MDFISSIYIAYLYRWNGYTQNSGSKFKHTTLPITALAGRNFTS
jgi:hypothetical protein